MKSEDDRIASELTDDELLDALSRLVRQSRRTEAALVSHIGEVDRRRLYARFAVPSMFVYCIGILHLSEAEAYRRITVARAAREDPRLLEMLASGELHLSGLARLVPHLTPQNRDGVLARAVHQTTRQIEALVAELSPRPDVPSMVRKLPDASVVRKLPDAASTLADRVLTNGGGEATARCDAATGCEATTASTTTILGGDPNGSSPPNQLVARRVDSLPPPARVPLASERTRIDVLAPGRYRVQFTASASLREKLERLRDMLRSSGPELDIAIVVERAVTAMLERIESRRFGATSKPSSKPPSARATRRQECSIDRRLSAEPPLSSAAPPQTASRYIPAAVRRAVRDRDGGRCRYVDAQGRRCPATRGLEFHHRRPYGHGGEHSADNLSLLCRTHNAYLAEIDYGAVKTPRRGGAASSRVSVPASQLSIPGSL